MSIPGGDRAILPQLDAHRIRLTNEGNLELNTGANRYGVIPFLCQDLGLKH